MGQTDVVTSHFKWPVWLGCYKPRNTDVKAPPPNCLDCVDFNPSSIPEQTNLTLTQDMSFVLRRMEEYGLQWWQGWDEVYRCMGGRLTGFMATRNGEYNKLLFFSIIYREIFRGMVD